MKPLNVWSQSDEEIGRLLSNFAHTPFDLDGVAYASVEGFYVSILIQSSVSRRDKVRRLWGVRAKQEMPRLKPVAFNTTGGTFDLAQRSTMISSNARLPPSSTHIHTLPAPLRPPRRAPSSMRRGTRTSRMRNSPRRCFAGYSRKSAMNMPAAIEYLSQDNSLPLDVNKSRLFPRISAVRPSYWMKCVCCRQGEPAMPDTHLDDEQDGHAVRGTVMTNSDRDTVALVAIPRF
jgi:hypothetical protein